ncbi:MAG TPA: long-chain fatty acid--CoA ligase [Candidatus Paraprevotella stercorigallinarum]|nr:long-chain fatty acid--CoA ligase [Candidatus Paraprevotella stercorigallinarum]
MLNTSFLATLIHEQAKIYGDKTVMSYRDYDKNEWIPITWSEFSDTVNKVSNALLALGVNVQENIAVFSQNKPECLYVDFGAYGIRAVTIPFYATSSEAQISYMVDDAEIRYIFVGEQEQYDIAFRIMPYSSTLHKLIIFDPKVVKNSQDTISIYFDEFLRLGEEQLHQKEVKKRMSEVQEDDLVNILYTSGTTGTSKGVMFTNLMYHDAMIANDKVLNLTENDVVLNFLPFTHVFERAWSYLCLAEGVRLCVNLRPADVLQSLQEVHPTCMCAVPRFWEKVYAGVQEKIRTSNPVQRALLQEALHVGKTYNVTYKMRGLQPPLPLKMRYKFFEKTVIALLKKTLGLENANFFPTAGAAVPPAVEEFVHAAGINMVTGYGLTESTATVSCAWKGLPKTIGSVGRVIDGLELKIGENDEILLKGTSITKGYYRKEDATRSAIDSEGWFHTGDAGYIKNGELFLTERIKDLFKTSNGKYIAPQMIESKLVVDRFIDQIVIIADQRKFVSALIVPDYAVLEDFARRHHISYTSIAELCRNQDIVRMILFRIDTLQQEFAHYEQVKRITLLPEPFSMEKGELTNTLKIKRNVVNQNYAGVIDEMYKENNQA